MFNKIPCSMKNLSVLAVVAVLLYVALNYTRPQVSKYHLSPGALQTTTAGTISDFFDAPYELACAPSAQEGGAYYTKDLTPGGLCGGQAIVNKLMHQYTITDGLGGSLLDA